MSETKGAAVKKHKSLARGLIAGLIAGLAATAAKALAERIFPPQPNHRAGAAGPGRRTYDGAETHDAGLQRRDRARPSAGDWARRSARPMARSPSSTPRHAPDGQAWGAASGRAHWRRCWPPRGSAARARPRRPARGPDRARARQRDHLLRRLRRHRRAGAQAGAPVALTAAPNHSQANSEARTAHATLRSYRLGDWQAMYALDLVCFEPVFQFSRGAMRAFAEAPGADDRAGRGARSNWQASASRSWNERTGYVVTLDVAPAFRRRGLARQSHGRDREQTPIRRRRAHGAACLHRKRGGHPLLRSDRLRARGRGEELLRARPARAPLPQAAQSLGRAESELQPALQQIRASNPMSPRKVETHRQLQISAS